RAGQTPATVAVDALPDETFLGVVHLVGQAADPATRTIEVEIRIPNPGHKLKGGMFARVNLVLDRKADVPVIPDTAILRDEQGPYVYVINDSKAHRRPVNLGLAEGVLHEVTEGLEPGDRVVVRGQRQLREGEALETVEENQP
ncbi:MAG: efflux RND transporter periplasmic adaptor subunit, partial [Planctomycetota bacterium]|nr:efflux RND transporter periplasmic adaptor subunit [Planctomycetota bacterium]